MTFVSPAIAALLTAVSLAAVCFTVVNFDMAIEDKLPIMGAKT